MIAEAISMVAGFLVGYIIGEPNRRRRFLAKLNDLTKPNKEAKP